MKYVILAGLLLLVLVEYAVCCISHDADDGAEEMAREWVEANREIVDSLQVGTISAKNIKYIEWEEMDDE